MKYVPAFDGLRAVAVLMVVLFHLHSNTFSGGWIGVDVFFVLSGYLITRILDAEKFKHGSIDLFRFYRNRVLRLAPALTLAMATVMLLTPLFHWSTSENLKSIFFALFYISNWNLAFGWSPGHALSHTWSLSVEEQFYFVWPLLFAAIPRRALPGITAMIILAALAWQVFLIKAGAAGPRIAFGSDTRSFSILLGCFIALVGNEKFNRLIAKFWLVPAFGIIWFALVFNFNAQKIISQPVATHVSALCTAWLVLSMPYTTKLNSFLSRPGLVYIGKISYGIYLWHQVILFLCTPNGIPASVSTRLLIDFAVIAGSIGLSALSFKYLELPILALKHKFQVPSKPQPKTLVL